MTSSLEQRLPGGTGAGIGAKTKEDPDNRSGPEDEVENDKREEERPQGREFPGQSL